MKKDQIFFGERGLTSTSANHIANMAKELYQTIEKELGNFVLYNTSISAVDSDSSKTIGLGKDKEFLDSIAAKLKRVGMLKSLIAWLREAIKARDNMLEELVDLTVEDYCEMIGVELPSLREFNESFDEPDMARALTEDEYYASLPVDERNRYYELETMASTIGKYIHVSGSFAVAREGLKEVIAAPAVMWDKYAEPLVKTFTPTVSVDEVDEVFFALQSLYREYQKELNSIKFKCEKACQESQIQAAAEYQQALQRYQDEKATRMASVMNRREALLNEKDLYVKREKERIMALKIIIPQSLKAIFDEVNSLGK